MNVAVIGLGLIGGSLLRALAAAGHRVTGFDADEATRVQVAAAGFTVAGTIKAAVECADLVASAVPLPVLDSIFGELAGFDGLVTDVTSVKGPVLELAQKHSLRRYVGGHPMTGKENSGFAASEPGLFHGCAWVLCLEPHFTAVDDWLTLAELITAMGARVVPVTAAEHDRAVAEVSHVPHLFAAVLADAMTESPLASTLAAGSFRDGTRVAATRAELILAMLEGNRIEVGHALNRMIDQLTTLRDATPADLLGYLRRSGDARRAWPPAAGEPTEIPVSAEELLALGRDGGWITEIAEDRATVIAIRPETVPRG